MQFQEQLFDGIPVCVATPAMLYRMKKATVRWKDRIDAQQLRDRFGLEDYSADSEVSFAQRY